MTETFDEAPTFDEAASSRDIEIDKVALEAQESGRAASLWSDAWRQCRHRPLFWICSTIIVVLVLAALFPWLFTTADPRECSLTRSQLRPSREKTKGGRQIGIGVRRGLRRRRGRRRFCSSTGRRRLGP